MEKKTPRKGLGETVDDERLRAFMHQQNCTDPVCAEFMAISQTDVMSQFYNDTFLWLGQDIHAYRVALDNAHQILQCAIAAAEDIEQGHPDGGPSDPARTATASALRTVVGDEENRLWELPSWFNRGPRCPQKH